MAGKECLAKRGQYLVEAAKENGIFIPTLCNYEGVPPKGSCRVCTCLINGRLMTACTTPVSEGMVIETHSSDIDELRKSIIELFFVEGNHFCPSCEKSGNCELQALAYRYQIMAPRFPFSFPLRNIDASHPKILKDHNRCILCKRCIRIIKDETGRSFFAFKRRGQNIEVILDHRLGTKLTDELAMKAEEICPVGSIMVKERAYLTPIGKRKYDIIPIGAEINNVNNK